MKLRILAFVFLWLSVDYFFFTAVRTVTDSYLIYTAYWLFDLVLVAMTIKGFMQKKMALVTRLITILLLTFISKFFTGILLFSVDVFRQFAGYNARSILVTGSLIFLSFVFILILIFILYQSRHHYKIHRTNISYTGLPEEFVGFTITQISDIHAGSFTSRKG